jgi:hypothetical protein
MSSMVARPALACVGLMAFASCAEGITAAADADRDGYEATVDCDDNNPSAHPGEPEVCDGVDNDCDGVADEPEDTYPPTWYPDADGDGWGSDHDPVVQCLGPEGYVDKGGDCDDGSASTYPGADENCAEDIDTNCDGSTGFADEDMDGFAACEDCDDTRADVSPAGTEVCDGADNDCNGSVDDGDLSVMCPVENGQGVCNGEMGCGVGSCDGEHDDANGVLEDGCECVIAPLPASLGDSCATAIDLGTFTDASQDLTALGGNGAPAGREIWYVVNAVDDVDTNGDEFHFDARFTTNPGDAYVMDVFRNGCPGTGEQVAQDEFGVVDWYTDQPHTTVGCTLGGACGEGNCGTLPDAPGQCQCDDDSATFHIRVRRLDGLSSCDVYALEVSNGVY